MADGGHQNYLRDERNVCHLCGKFENLSLCVGCRDTWYCCKEHQKADWKKHKGACKGKCSPKTKCMKEKQVTSDIKHAVIDNGSTSTNPLPNINEIATTDTICRYDNCQEIQEQSSRSARSTTRKSLDEKLDQNTTLHGESGNDQLLPTKEEGISKSDTLCSCRTKSSDTINKISSNNTSAYEKTPIEPTSTKTEEAGVLDNSETYFAVLKTRFDVLAKYVINCLNKYGICVIDNFLGDSKGTEILEEVKKLRSSGVFTEGQLVNSASNSSQTIRGDVLTWVDEKEEGCQNIHFLISCMDAVILRCGNQLEFYDINERTKAMVACYPGNNTGYVRHVDNPNGDGRCVTCIYYLNKNWDVTKYGGMLRIYPEGQDQVANIEPSFDRLLFFWSDRRNPHEVRPSQLERYAITVWYYDKKERGKALKQLKGQNSKSQRKVAVPLICGNDQ